MFVALGTVVARLFDHDRISIFENGLVSLNLPPVAQVVGARATRTTHPQVLAGFGRLFLNVLSCPFEVTNPFLWVTKEEVIKLIVANQCSDLIRDTRSWTRVHDMTVLHSHCGRCSQCIDRRFAIIAAGQESEDPAEAYRTDLFLGERRPGPDREMALAYVRSASAVSRMTDIAFFSHYGETSRVVGFFPESTDTVASCIFDLHQRHAATVCRVFDHTIASHASKLREGTLPTDCLLSLMVSQREGESVYPRTIGGPEQPVSVGPEIRVAVDARRYRVVFEGWGEIGGACAELVIALSEQYLQAAQDEIGLERDLFIKSANLAHKIKCNSEETLRRRILRCRKSISKLAVACGGHPLSVDSVIENSQWHGYRLNPDRVRVIQVSELSGGRVGHASPLEGHASPARRR